MFLVLEIDIGDHFLPSDRRGHPLHVSIMVFHERGHGEIEAHNSVVLVFKAIYLICFLLIKVDLVFLIESILGRLVIL